MEIVAARVSEKEGKLPREAVLREFVRYSKRATRGMASQAEAEGKKVVAQMVRAGRLTPEQGDKVLATLMARVMSSREDFEKRVDESIQRAAKRLGEISKREITKLADKAELLEKRLQRLSR